MTPDSTPTQPVTPGSVPREMCMALLSNGGRNPCGLGRGHDGAHRPASPLEVLSHSAALRHRIATLEAAQPVTEPEDARALLRAYLIACQSVGDFPNEDRILAAVSAREPGAAKFAVGERAKAAAALDRMDDASDRHAVENAIRVLRAEARTDALSLAVIQYLTLADYIAEFPAADDIEAKTNEQVLLEARDHAYATMAALVPPAPQAETRSADFDTWRRAYRPCPNWNEPWEPQTPYVTPGEVDLMRSAWDAALAAAPVAGAERWNPHTARLPCPSCVDGEVRHNVAMPSGYEDDQAVTTWLSCNGCSWRSDTVPPSAVLDDETRYRIFAAMYDPRGNLDEATLKACWAELNSANGFGEWKARLDAVCAALASRVESDAAKESKA